MTEPTKQVGTSGAGKEEYDMKLLKVDSLEQAREKLMEHTADWKLEMRRSPFEDAVGQLLAEAVFSPGNVPDFTRSTMDGYAVRASDTAAAGESIPVLLTLVGQVEMGRSAECCVASGQCAAISTGGMLPEGADAVVMVEHTEPFGDGIAIYSSVALGENTVLAGEDIKKGGLLLKQGTRLLPQQIGALAAAGVTELTLLAPLRLTLISTGDELISPREMLKAGQVRDINSYALAAQAKRCGYDIVEILLLPDDGEVLREAVQTAMRDSDLVLVSGGSSQGEKDITATVLDEVSVPGLLTHGIAVKPGKPTILAYDAPSRTILGGLPGHPVSAMMVFELLFSWFYRQKTGEEERPAIPAALNCNLAASPGKLNCWPVRLERGEAGWRAVPVFGKSGLISTLCEADGYFTVERSREGVSAGELVDVHLF